MGALELANLPKLCPCTKHINLYYRHFHEHVCSRKIKIYPIATKLQTADIVTKALPQNLLYGTKRRFLAINHKCYLRGSVVISCNFVFSLKVLRTVHQSFVYSRLIGT